MAVFKILFLFVAVQLVHSKPLLFKEMHMKRNFEFSLKPIKFPITFIKEKWSSLGHVGSKHAVVKRSPIEVSPIVMPVKHEHDEAPLFKETLEKSLDAVPPVSPILPPPIENELSPIGLPVHHIYPRPVIEEHPLPEELSSPAPHGFLSTVSVPPVSKRLPSYEVTEGYNHMSSSIPPESREVFITPTSHTPPFHPVTAGPAKIITPYSPPRLRGAVVNAPPVGISLIEGESKMLSSTLPPPAGIREFNVAPQVGLLTDIARVDQINSYLKAVDGLPLIKPPLEENLLPGNSIEAEGQKDSGLSGSLVKGSRIALYFGNILLQVMSEVISSARSAISQYSKPAPI